MSMLKRMEDKSIFSIQSNPDGTFCLKEEGDQWFVHTVTADEVRQLGEEIIALANQVKNPNQQELWLP